MVYAEAIMQSAKDSAPFNERQHFKPNNEKESLRKQLQDRTASMSRPKKEFKQMGD